MKKMLFSAIAMVAFAVSTFASNEVVKNEDTSKKAEITKKEFDTNCSVTLVYTQGGKSYIKTIEWNASGRTQCSNLIRNAIIDAEKNGAKITESNTCYQTLTLTK